MTTNRWMCVLASIAVGCAGAETTELPPAAATPTTEGDEVTTVTVSQPVDTQGPALAQRYQECWNALNTKQWDTFSGCYAENATSEWLDTGMPVATSRTDIIEKQAKPFVAAFPDFRGDVQLMLVSGTKMLTLAMVRGTHDGTLISPAGAIPATHKKVGLLVGHVIEMNDQKQGTKEQFVQDMGTMMAQLGLSPAPARPATEPNWPATETAIATGSETERKNLEAAQKMLALFDAHDKAMLDLAADDIVDKNPSFPADLVGKAAMGELMSSFWTAFPDAKANVTATWAAGDYVVAEYVFTGTNKGPMPAFGITTPTGKPFALHVIEITQWKDGKVKAIWPMFNGVALAAQLGLLPPPSAAGTAPAAAPEAPAKGKTKAKTKG